MNHKGLLVVVSGFSGVGKGTLVQEARESNVTIMHFPYP